MIREQRQSQTENDTLDGFTIPRIFTCEWSEWVDGFGAFTDGGAVIDPWYFPWVGDEWPGAPHLVVTHRKPEEHDGKCRVRIEYSTEGDIARAGRPDEVTSWEEELDFESEEIPVLGWTDQDGKFWDWTKVWTKEISPPGGEGPIDPIKGKPYEKGWATADNRPEFIDRVTRGVYTFTCYGSEATVVKLLNNKDKINSTKFLEQISAKKSAVDPRHKDDVWSFNDVGKWLFKGAQRRRVKRGVYRFNLIFVYDADGWNWQHNYFTNKHKSIDLFNLLEEMKNISDDTYGGMHGTV